jgi:hypothetical protein
MNTGTLYRWFEIINTGKHYRWFERAKHIFEIMNIFKPAIMCPGIHYFKYMLRSFKPVIMCPGIHYFKYLLAPDQQMASQNKLSLWEEEHQRA